MPKATLAWLGKDEAKLRAVLLYHVVKGKATADRIEVRRGAFHSQELPRQLDASSAPRLTSSSGT